jgi:hypothetical protein
MTTAFVQEEVGRTLILEGKLSKQLIHVDPFNCVAAINPRDLSELEWETLMPDVVKTEGIISQPILLWKVSPDHEIWTSGLIKDPYTNTPITVPLEEREKTYILIRGHRRHMCLCVIRNNDRDYSKAVYDNAAKVKALVFEGPQREAETLALDFEEIRGLHKWEVTRIVVKRLSEDYTSEEICNAMPQLLFGALIDNGAVEYDSIVREAGHDGRKRQTDLDKKLKNHVHNGVTKIFQMGYPAMTDQLVNYFRFFKDKRPEGKEGSETARLKKSVVLDLRMTNIQKMVIAFNQAQKDQNWTPIEKVAIVEEKPKEDAYTSFTECGTTGYYVVVGGTEAFRAFLLQNMKHKNEPETAAVVKPPNKTDRAGVQSGSMSAVGKATAKYLNEGDKTPQEGKWLKEPRMRVEWDQWAAFSESVQASLLTLTDLDPMVKEVVDALTKVLAPEAGAKLVTTAFMTLNEYVKAARVKPVAKAKK